MIYSQQKYYDWLLDKETVIYKRLEIQIRNSDSVLIRLLEEQVNLLPTVITHWFIISLYACDKYEISSQTWWNTNRQISYLVIYP